MKTTRSKETPKTFAELCKELGTRISSTENALLCYRAYEAYLVEYPDTARGKGNKLDRDPSTTAFRKKAAEASAVAPATIDALLQVGKALAPLPEKAKLALVGSSLGNSMRLLRKLATKEHAKDRADLITNFATQEKTDAKSAKNALKRKLGMTPSRREGVEAREVRRQSGHLAEGEYLELAFDRYLVRVEVGGQAGGRIHLTATAVAGEKKQLKKFLESAQVKPDLERHASKPMTPAKKARELAA